MGGAGLRIMGIQDSYLPWSRANPLNGKPVVAETGQVAFDDCIFDKDESQGAYIYAVHTGPDCSIAVGGKEALMELFCADEPHSCEPGNLALLHRAVLYERDNPDCAVHDADYF